MQLNYNSYVLRNFRISFQNVFLLYFSLEILLFLSFAFTSKNRSDEPKGKVKILKEKWKRSMNKKEMSLSANCLQKFKIINQNFEFESDENLQKHSF